MGRKYNISVSSLYEFCAVEAVKATLWKLTEERQQEKKWFYFVFLYNTGESLNYQLLQLHFVDKLVVEVCFSKQP